MLQVSWAMLISAVLIFGYGIISSKVIIRSISIIIRPKYARIYSASLIHRLLNNVDKA
jgi:hypothetical protein